MMNDEFANSSFIIYNSSFIIKNTKLNFYLVLKNFLITLRQNHRHCVATKSFRPFNRADTSCK